MFLHEYSSQTRGLSSFMYKVYGWMSLGLFLTAATAYGVYVNPSLFAFFLASKFAFFGIFIAQIAIVIAFSAFIKKMSYPTAIVAFVVYSVLMGLTMSSIFFIYQIASIYMVFVIATGMFGTMAVYGYLTKADLTGFGNIMIMGLIGLLIGSLVNMFMQSSSFHYFLSFLGVAVFTGLVAYDVQRIKSLGFHLIGQGELESKVALVGALTLYLDFINLFLFLLQLLGKRKD